MNIELKNRFIDLWSRYFRSAELPIIFYYTEDSLEPDDKPKGRSCLICELAKVRKGNTAIYNGLNVSCSGGKRFLGFQNKMRPDFEYFLSCGKEGLEGERYKQTPAIVNEIMQNQEFTDQKGKCIVFKRWDKIEENENPDVVIFFAKPDVLSGLFTLSNFDRVSPDGTITPFGSGCSSIVYLPYIQSRSEDPKAIIGMFDPSARPCVPENYLTFALPMKRFEKIIGYMEESFLITGTWTTVQKRIERN